MSLLPDQFEVFNLLLKTHRYSLLREGIAYGVAILCLFAAILAWSRPLPVIVKSDRPDEATYLVEASNDSLVRAIDAKKFLHKTAVLMHGWSSTTVMKDLFEASTLMTPKWREKFLSYVNEKVDGQTERVTIWAGQSIDNQLNLDWKETDCKQVENRWQCRSSGILEVRSLTNAGPIQSIPIEIRANLVQIPLTESTIDGLLIDFFELVKGKV